MTDMVAQGILGADPDGVDDAAGEIGLQGRGEGVMGEFLDQPGGGNVLGEGRDLVGGRESRTRVEEVVGMNLPGCCGPTSSCGSLDSRGREPPCAGTAVKTYIQEALPGLSRLSKTLGRCGISSVLVCCLRGNREIERKGPRERERGEEGGRGETES